MSVNTVEALLYKLANDTETLQQFSADPAKVLGRYPLSPVEQRRILDWDLHALIDSGVSPMLLSFGYTATHGGMASRNEYIRLLQLPRTAPAETASLERADHG